MIERLVTEWSVMELDRDRQAIRFVEKRAAATGPLAAHIDRDSGLPGCFLEGDPDPDGWLTYAEIVRLEVGKRCRWRWHDGHPRAGYVGSRLVAIEPL